MNISCKVNGLGATDARVAVVPAVTKLTVRAFLVWLFTDFDLHSGERLRSLQTHRAAGRTPAVFRFAMDGESKNPVKSKAIGLPCRGKVLSFAYFSLHEQRKVGRA
jgi:hypothetical protein